MGIHFVSITTLIWFTVSCERQQFYGIVIIYKVGERKKKKQIV